MKATSRPSFEDVRFFFGQALFDEPDIEPIQIAPDYWDEVGTCEWKRDKDIGDLDTKWNVPLTNPHESMLEDHKRILKVLNEEIHKEWLRETTERRLLTESFIQKNEEKILEMHDLLGQNTRRLFDIFRRVIFPGQLHDGDLNWFIASIKKHRISSVLRK